MLQRINRSEAPVHPGTEVGNALDELIGGMTCDIVDQANTDTRQERLAASPSQYEKILTRRENECANHKIGVGSPHRQQHGQTNEIYCGGDVGEESDESVVQGDEIRAQNYPEVRKSGYDPTIKGEVE